MYSLGSRQPESCKLYGVQLGLCYSVLLLLELITRCSSCQHCSAFNTREEKGGEEQGPVFFVTFRFIS